MTRDTETPTSSMFTTTYSLLSRLQQPDTSNAAWQRFVALYTPLLQCWARRLGLNASDASDLLQEVFLVVLRELPSFQPTPQHRFRGWLWTIARNKACELRRRTPQLFVSGEGTEPMAPDEIAARETAEELALLSRRAAALLQTDFPTATWKAFWETAVEGRSGKEVALELGMTVGAVYAARFRLQQRLREELGEILD